MTYFTATKIQWVFIGPVTLIQGVKFVADPVAEFGWSAVIAFCLGMLIPATRDARHSAGVISLSMPRRTSPTVDVDAMLRELDAEMEGIHE